MFGRRNSSREEIPFDMDIKPDQENHFVIKRQYDYADGWSVVVCIYNRTYNNGRDFNFYADYFVVSPNRDAHSHYRAVFPFRANPVSSRPYKIHKFHGVEQRYWRDNRGYPVNCYYESDACFEDLCEEQEINSILRVNSRLDSLMQSEGINEEQNSKNECNGKEIKLVLRRNR